MHRAPAADRPRRGAPGAQHPARRPGADSAPSCGQSRLWAPQHGDCCSVPHAGLPSFPEAASGTPPVRPRPRSPAEPGLRQRSRCGAGRLRAPRRGRSMAGSSPRAHRRSPGRFSPASLQQPAGRTHDSTPKARNRSAAGASFSPALVPNETIQRPPGGRLRRRSGARRTRISSCSAATAATHRRQPSHSAAMFAGSAARAASAPGGLGLRDPAGPKAELASLAVSGRGSCTALAAAPRAIGRGARSRPRPAPGAHCAGPGSAAWLRPGPASLASSPSASRLSSPSPPPSRGSCAPSPAPSKQINLSKQGAP